MAATIGKWTGDPTEGKGLLKRLGYVIDDAGKEIVGQIADIRQRAMDEHLGPGGLAKTPEAKQTFLNRSNGLFSSVTWQGKPVFDEGAQSTQRREQAAPGAPQSATPSAPVKINPDVFSKLSVGDKAKVGLIQQVKPGEPRYQAGQDWLRAHGF